MFLQWEQPTKQILWDILVTPDTENHQTQKTTRHRKPPDRFDESNPEHPKKVRKLKESIYGLKQSARCWNQTLDYSLWSRGYHKSGADSCIYIKSEKKADGFISFVILAVYVDDIIPVSNDIEMLKAEKEFLCKEFKMVDQRRNRLHSCTDNQERSSKENTV